MPRSVRLRGIESSVRTQRNKPMNRIARIDRQDVFPAQFVNWKMVDDKKVPCDAAGNEINPHLPLHWRSRDQAASSRRRFVITANDPYFFVDLDHCRDGNAWNAASLDILARFPGAAMEASSSGNGLHIIGRCDKSRVSGVTHRNKFEGWCEFYTDRALCETRDFGFWTEIWRGFREVLGRGWGLAARWGGAPQASGSIRAWRGRRAAGSVRPSRRSRRSQPA